MGRACSSAALATSGRLPECVPDFSIVAPSLIVGAGRWFCLPNIVGRAEEIGGFDDALDDPAQGRSVDRARRGARDRQDPPARRARSARRATRQLVLSGRAAELEQDLPFWVFVDALDESLQGLDRAAWSPWARRARRARPGPAVAGTPPRRRRAMLQHERYRTHRACASCSSSWRRRSRSCSCSTISTGRTPDRWTVGALLRRPPAAPVLMALAVRPRQISERLAAAFELADREGSLIRLELGSLTRGEAGELLGEAVEVRPRPRSTRRAGATLSISSSSPWPQWPGAPGHARPTTSAGGMEVPPMVAAALTEELALLSDDVRRVLEGAAVAGDPFEPELTAAAAAYQRIGPRALDELLTSTSSATPTCPAAFASGTPWCAGRSTRRHHAAGGSARMSAARRRSRRVGPLPQRARTT